MSNFFSSQLSNVRPTLAIVGKANAGKSTLFNALLGTHLSIVSHRANTTRQQLQADINFGENVLTCIDTPGVNAQKGMAYDDLKLMRRAVNVGIESAQLILFVSDALKWSTEDGKILSSLVQHRQSEPHKKFFWIINKIDTVPKKEKFLPHIQKISEGVTLFDEVLLLSAKELNGTRILKEKLLQYWSLSPEQEQTHQKKLIPDDDTIVFHLKEAIREQIYTYCYAEIPYIVEISVERSLEPRQNSGNRWHITLWVDRSSQKKILMGRSALQLKKIREQTQERLRSLFGIDSILSFHVSLKKDRHASSNGGRLIETLHLTSKNTKGQPDEF